jgi:hypothetical protein
VSTLTYWNIVEVFRTFYDMGQDVDAETVRGIRSGAISTTLSAFDVDQAKAIVDNNLPRFTPKAFHAYDFKVLNSGGLEWIEGAFTKHQLFAYDQEDTLKAIDIHLGASKHANCLLLYSYVGGNKHDERDEWHFEGIIDPERLKDIVLVASK